MEWKVEEGGEGEIVEVDAAVLSPPVLSGRGQGCEAQKIVQMICQAHSAFLPSGMLWIVTGKQNR